MPQRSSRVEDAYNRLKADILDNLMPPGFQGTEPEVAERLRMSRTPVREALVRLQNEGLVELVPRRGVRVLPISPDDMRDIYQILTALEPEAAADVARQGLTEVQITELEETTHEMEEALRLDDLDRWAAADDRFHRLLLGYGTNQRLIGFINTLFDQAHRARVVTLRLRERPRQSTDDHKVIQQAIIARDPEGTRAAFRAHREQAARELLRLLENTRITQL